MAAEAEAKKMAEELAEREAASRPVGPYAWLVAAWDARDIDAIIDAEEEEV